VYVVKSSYAGLASTSGIGISKAKAKKTTVKIEISLFIPLHTQKTNLGSRAYARNHAIAARTVPPINTRMTNGRIGSEAQTVSNMVFTVLLASAERFSSGTMA